MHFPKRQALFKYLAAISIAAGCGVLRPSPRLLSIPEELVTEVLDAVATSGEPSWDKSDRKRVLRLLASDPRESIRTRVATAAVALDADWPDEAQGLILGLSRDSSPTVRASAAHALQSLLERASPVQRVELVCRAGVSEHSAERLALAQALCSSTPILVADWVLEQLSLDGDAAVRLSALRAAQKRFAESPSAYSAIGQQLLLDSSARVRREARRFVDEIARA